MTDHTTATREEWLAARLELLEAEKALTRRSDELARQRQELPWVRIDKEYRLETDQGTASVADLFSGRSQLLIYHFRGVGVGSDRVQLPQCGLSAASRSGQFRARRVRIERRRNGLGDVPARRARRERVHARRWRRLPHLLRVRAWSGRPLGDVPVARPRAAGSQRGRLLVASPRRVRQPVTGPQRRTHE
jgi:hypothetical protein